jgi:hypothetical protein
MDFDVFPNSKSQQPEPLLTMRPTRLLNLSDQLLRQADLPTVLRARRSPAFARAFFHTTRHRADIVVPKRYGSAREPPPHLADGEKPAASATNAEKFAESSVIEVPEAEQVKALPAPPAAAAAEEPNNPSSSPEAAAKAAETPTAAAAEGESPKPPPSSLERVLDVTSPLEAEASKAPHLQAPKYVHHFDTWSLVKDLQQSGFTQDQSVTVMKAVRGLLAENMELARSALVSKSNVENVSFIHTVSVLG